MTPSPPAPEPDRGPRFPLRAVFRRSSAAVFVLGPTRRLRYANPAWETLIGRSLAEARGTRVSGGRRSASPLWAALAPPPEVWAGRPATVRRAPPGAVAGPPWWDVSFVPLPGEGGKLLGLIGTVTVVGAKAGPAAVRLAAAVGEARRRHAAMYRPDLFAGPSPASERLRAQVRHAAHTSAPLWLTGEPGAGKETLARVAHHTGPGRERGFVAVDCGGLQPYLVEGLLFGKGGLLAGGHIGTLYLADPAALPRDSQERVARTFATAARGSPRLVCGADRPAAELVAAGQLVSAFHTALSVLEVRVPSLRERPDDLPGYVDRLLDRHRVVGGAKPAVADDILPVLRCHDWPGNVRELADALASAVAVAGAGPLRAAHLPRFLREKHLIASDPRPPAGATWTLDAVLEAVERRLIELALADAGGNQTAAAERLGVLRARLGRRVEALGVAGKGKAEGP